jgi:putative peptidoglycan lipid II flippase
MPIPKETKRESHPSSMRKSLLGAAGSVSIATMISRILGVVREMVMARYFGAGFFTDAFYTAYRIPNLLRDLFAEGALSSAFVPTFIRTRNQKGNHEAWLLANMVINALAILLGATTLLFFFGADWFVYLLASGFAEIPEKFELTVQMTRIMSPFLLCVAMAAVVMGMLNAFGFFFIPALAPSSFNVCVILAGIFLSPVMPRFGLEPIVSMALGALLGGLSQFLVQVPKAHRVGFRYRLKLNLSYPGLRHMGKLMLPAVIGLSATQINILVDNQLASHLGNGPVSWLNYAFRLMQLPIGVFGVAIATATLATVSHHAASNSIDQVRKTILSSLRLAACLTFPSTAGLILFREEIVRLLYQRGSFTPEDTVETSNVLIYYAFALFAYSAVKILVPTFYALNDTRTPVKLSVISIAAKVALNFLFVVPLGCAGLALATAMASWLNFSLLLHSLSSRTGAPWGWSQLRIYLRIGLATAVMVGFSLAVFELISLLAPLGGTPGLALNLGLAISAAILVFLPLLRLFGIKEAGEIANLTIGRIMSKRS